MTPITIDQLIVKIHDWSGSHGLHKGDPYKQMIKITEEVGELAQGLLKRNDEQILDSVGDIIITLTIFCQQRNIDITNALNYAYTAIEYRKGNMVMGTFIKDEDIRKSMYEPIEITESLASVIIADRTPIGNYYYSEQYNGKRTYVAIDNTTGDAWTEEFDNKKTMLDWLGRREI